VEIRDIADFLSEYDMIALFGNLLNNAVEAACVFPDPFIEVNPPRKANTPLIVISVVNSSRKNPFAD